MDIYIYILMEVNNIGYQYYMAIFHFQWVQNPIRCLIYTPKPSSLVGEKYPLKNHALHNESSNQHPEIWPCYPTVSL